MQNKTKTFQSTIYKFFTPIQPVHQNQVPHIPQQTLSSANDAVIQVVSGPKAKHERSEYASYTPKRRLEIGKFAHESSPAKAARKFIVPDSTARYFKKLYEHELSTQIKNENIAELHPQKRGTPTLLPTEIDDMLKAYLLALRSNGGAVNSIIIKAVARALLISHCKHLMKENGGHSTYETMGEQLCITVWIYSKAWDKKHKI